MLILQAIDNLTKEELIDIISLIECSKSLKAKLKVLKGKGIEVLEVSAKAVEKTITTITTRITRGRKTLKPAIFKNIKHRNIYVDIFAEKEKMAQKLNMYSAYSLKFCLLVNLKALAHSKGMFPEQICEDVIKKVARFYRIKTSSRSDIEIERKIFEKFIEKSINQIKDMVDSGAIDETKLEKEVNESLKSLSRLEKERIMKELKLDELSYRSIKNILTGIATGSGIYLFAESAGFSLYIATSIFLKSISTLLGVTFPFTVYVGASTILGFLTGIFGVSLITAIFTSSSLLQIHKQVNLNTLSLIVSILYSKTLLSEQYQLTQG